MGGNPETKTKLPEVTETTPPVIAFDVSKLFYNFSSVIGEPECAENLFIPKASRVESLTIWKTDRSEIRKDFKKQAKEAKRLVRRKQNISNPRLVA